MKRLQNFIYNQHSTKYYKSEKKLSPKTKSETVNTDFFLFSTTITL